VKYGIGGKKALIGYDGIEYGDVTNIEVNFSKNFRMTPVRLNDY
jgi:hypothetical protein